MNEQPIHHRELLRSAALFAWVFIGVFTDLPPSPLVSRPPFPNSRLPPTIGHHRPLTPHTKIARRDNGLGKHPSTYFRLVFLEYVTHHHQNVLPV
ncbi:hypothetical protein Hypma_004501 [Hypsizygus marmoreus]|uniref:Uncharacterized protein n=1 Tax=Hypsizygus marmoreus TaxID=39966 RepID=A0A369K3P4_HYPMA|nr:hypothetical protein Hypma_004501 [Hypsizygus marmoreus]